MAARFIIANPRDNVAIALVDLHAGEKIAHDCVLTMDIMAGHKFALVSLADGAPVIKLGHLIGVASRPIAAGAHVHSHNLHFTTSATSSDIGVDVQPLTPVSATFDGYVRDSGRVGTRNYVGVLTSVNCSATVARRIAAHFTSERLAAYPNVDGVVAFSHMSGCGMAKEGRGINNLRRTIKGYAANPNFAAVLIIGLGCEVNQVDQLVPEAPDSIVQSLTIQDAGGTAAAIQAGIKMVEAMLPAANQYRRQPVSAAHLTVGLQCGASDGYSAITANPALGAAVDRLIRSGGKAILSETPEIYGAEHLLLRRAASPAVAEKLSRLLAWWENYAARDGASLDNNPSPGNKAGGITTILEKSLGAVAKAGSSPLNAVIDYAEPVESAGLTFMDSPGYDPCSATGQIASGAQLILFTTGRGSVFGSIPSPTIKLASNADLARRMADDIDIDTSPILDGISVADMGTEIFELILATASGQTTASEALGVGENEWVPWVPGAMF